MRPLSMPLLPLLILLIAAAPPSQAAANDCAALQTEVETLRARIRTLETAQGAAPAAVPASAATLPGTAAKPPAVQTVLIEEPYSRTGCSKGLFKGVAAAAWQDASLWLDLEKGQSAAAVEKLLGIEHYDERGGGKVIWHYGRCGSKSMAQVLFTEGKLSDWRAPPG